MSNNQSFNRNNGFARWNALITEYLTIHNGCPETNFQIAAEYFTEVLMQSGASCGLERQPTLMLSVMLSSECWKLWTGVILRVPSWRITISIPLHSLSFSENPPAVVYTPRLLFCHLTQRSWTFPWTTPLNSFTAIDAYTRRNILFLNHGNS